MKIFEVTQSLESDQFQKIKNLQDISRAGLDWDAKDIGRASFSGIDQVDVKGRERQQKASDELTDKEREIDQKIAKLDKRSKKGLDKERRDRERSEKASRRAREKEVADRKAARDDQEFNKRVNKTSADRRNLKRGSDGRILKDPRYYGKNDSRGKERGAIGKAVDRVITDPAYAVSKYYKDTVDNVKDFLNTRI
jgi:hypothetical protein